MPYVPIWQAPTYTPSDEVTVTDERTKVNVVNRWTCGLNMVHEQVGSVGVGVAVPVASSSKKTFCLKARNGDYVVSENDAMSVNANRKVCGPWEKHEFTDLNGGTLSSGDYVSIKSHKNRYWSAQSNGVLKANRTSVGAWEKFKIVKATGSGAIVSGDSIRLEGAHGRWVVAEGGGGQVVKANRPSPGAWETFILEDP